MVTVHVLSAGFEDGVEALLLGWVQRLHELLLGDVGTEERASVLHVSPVHHLSALRERLRWPKPKPRAVWGLVPVTPRL